MEELSRIKLYTWILEQEGSIKDIFIPIIGEERYNSFIRTLKRTLKINIMMLTGLENHFLVESGKELSEEAFSRVLKNNIERVKRELETDLKYYFTITEGKQAKGNVYSLFNKLIKKLDEDNNNWLDSFFKLFLSKEHQVSLSDNYQNTTKNKIFISYSHNDRLYVLCLFIYLKIKGAQPYVDWLYQGALDNGTQIKQSLIPNITIADQFLFIRSTNSELQLQGNQEVKGWCAWELGAFYCYSKGTEKYYLQLYSKIGKSNMDPNSQLDNLMRLTSVESRSGKLQSKVKDDN